MAASPAGRVSVCLGGRIAGDADNRNPGCTGQPGGEDQSWKMFLAKLYRPFIHTVKLWAPGVS